MKLLGVLLLGGVPLVVLGAACGSNGNSEFDGGGGGGGGDDASFTGDDASFNADALGGPLDGAFDPDAFFAKDPPPKWCGPDASPAPPVPGGTPDCPDDKNREGCPCPTVGMTAPCWPGLRANRHLGICKDGTTTCQQFGEFSKTWGPCVGYVLPQPGATLGKEACKCFSEGTWAIANLVPCFVTYTDAGGNQTTWGISTHDGACPTVSGAPPYAKPAGIWSTDSLNVDCQGHFELCYTLKAGDYANPQATDCVVSQVCTEADYPTPGATEPFPDLDSWTTTTSTCSQQFAATGGYGEMTVIGESWACEDISNAGQPEVFHRVQYCKLSCQTNPSDPACASCMQGGSGQF